jgi:two-component system OmpR family response regulator
MTMVFQPKIMIVDDMVQNLNLLSGMLANYGYQVFTLTSGEQALKAATTNLPDLIPLDIRMSELDKIYTKFSSNNL